MFETFNLKGLLPVYVRGNAVQIIPGDNAGSKETVLVQTDSDETLSCEMPHFMRETLLGIRGSGEHTHFFTLNMFLKRHRGN